MSCGERNSSTPHSLGMSVDDGAMMRTYTGESVRETFDGLKKFDETKFLSGKPKIVMEHITRRLATNLILITYVVFFVCFVADTQSLFSAFNREDRTRQLTAEGHCTGMEGESLQAACGTTASCNTFYEDASTDADDGTISWIGHVNDIQNIVAFKMGIRGDESSNYTAAIPDFRVDYSVYITADLHSDPKCSVTFSVTEGSLQEGHHVLTMDNHLNLFDYVRDDGILSVDLFDFTVQNQETIPTQGLIRGYNLRVDYTVANASMLRAVNSTLQGLTYDFTTLNRASSSVFTETLNFFVIFVTLISFGFFLRRLYTTCPDYKDWLPEQCWAILYFVALICYQNPVFSVLNVIDSDNDGHAAAAYTSFVLDAVGQSGLFLAWLLFADCFAGHFSEPLSFYFPKLLLTFAILTCNIIVASLYFPTLFEDQHRGAYEAVINWPDGTQQLYVGCALAFMGAACFFLVVFVLYLWRSFNSLQRINYMESRFMQLSFRYFLLQGWGIVGYYVLNYLIMGVIFFSGSKNTDSAQDNKWGSEEMAESVNILFKQSIHLEGKIFFLTTYVVIMAFLVSPVYDSEGKAMTVAFIQFAITEDEVDDILAAKKSLLQDLESVSLMNTLTQGMVNVEPRLFCVEMSLIMLGAAWQAYYDPPAVVSESGIGELDVASAGFVLVAYEFDPDTECFCLILKHKHKKIITVSFRGTNCSKHWDVNRKYHMTYPDLYGGLGDIDAQDELQDAVDKHTDTVARLQRTQRQNNGWGPLNSSKEVDGDDEHGRMVQGLLNVGTMAKQAVVGTGKMVYHIGKVTVDKTIGMVPGMGKEPIGFHQGFYEMYEQGARQFMHRALRDVLKAHPDHRLCFTGHSLGAALATIAAVDFKLNSVPRLECWAQAQVASLDAMGARSRRRSWIASSCNALQRVELYTYGSPRCGNAAWQSVADDAVKENYRNTIFGDIVTDVPPRRMGFRHVGLEVQTDHEGAGSILIDPGFLDKRLRRKLTKLSVSKHALSTYKTSMEGVMSAAMYLVEQQRRQKEDSKDEYGGSRKKGSLVSMLYKASRRAMQLNNHDEQLENLSAGLLDRDYYASTDQCGGPRTPPRALSARETEAGNDVRNGERADDSDMPPPPAQSECELPHVSSFGSASGNPHPLTRVPSACRSPLASISRQISDRSINGEEDPYSADAFERSITYSAATNNCGGDDMGLFDPSITGMPNMIPSLSMNNFYGMSTIGGWFGFGGSSSEPASAADSTHTSLRETTGSSKRDSTGTVETDDGAA